MQRQLPPLNALRAFEAAGRHESFSGAAQELGVSHSSISRHIRGLEDRLNRQLFRDLPRGVALTREGAGYLAEITPALDAISEATERLTERPAGLVSVNSEPLFATKWVMLRLAEFQNAHPEIEIRLEASRGLADVDRYEADMAIRFLSVPGSNPDAILISDAPLYPYAAPGVVDLPLSSPLDLLKYPLLRDRTSGTWSLWFELAGCPVDPSRVPGAGWRMRSPLAFEAALVGHGVLLTSADVTAHDVVAGRLERISDVGFREGGYYLVLGEGVLRRKPVRLFKEWLLARSADLRGKPV